MLILFLIFNIFLGDIVYLKSQEELFGKVEKIVHGKVYLKTEKGLKIIPLEDVSSILFTKRRYGDTWNDTSDVEDISLKKIIRKYLSKNFNLNVPYIILYGEKILEINPDTSWIYTERKLVKILTQSGAGAGNVVKYYFSNFGEGELIYAQGITQKGEIVSIREDAIEDAPLYPEYPLYLSYKRLKFAVPEARRGNIINWAYRERYKSNPAFPLSLKITLGSKRPVLKEKFILIYPKEFKIKFRYDTLLKFLKEEEGNKIKLVFTLEDFEGITSEPLMPSLSGYLLPKIIVSLPYDFESYLKIFKDSLNKGFEEVKKIVKDFNDDREIFRWVCKNVKTQYVKTFVNGYIPYSIGTILKNGKGGMKEKVFLLYALLKAKGYNPKFAFLNDRISNPVDTALRGMWGFDNVAVYLNGKFLYPFDENTSYGWLPSRYTGTFAFLLPDQKWIKVQPKVNKENSEMYISFDKNGDLKVDLEITWWGDIAKEMRKVRYYPEEKVEKMVQEMISDRFEGVENLKFKFLNLNEPDKPLKIKLNFRVPSYIVMQNKFSFMPLPLSYYKHGLEEKRKYPLIWDDYYISEEKIILKTDKKLYFPLKKSIKLEGKGLFYSFEWKKTKNAYIFVEKYRRKTLWLSQKDYSIYYEISKRKADMRNIWLIFK